MWQIIVSELTQATHGIIRSVAQFLPRLLVMLVIVVVGWVIAYVLKSIIRSILRVTKFDKLSEDAGASQLLKKAALPPSSELLSRFVFWVAWLGFILVGISVLGVVGFQEQIARFFAFLPRLFVAMFVFFFGLLASSFFSRAALLASVNANLPSPKLLSLTIRTMIIVFSISVGVEAVGVGENTMLVAFALMFGALMLGLALAFGLGGQDLARKYLEKRFVQPRQDDSDDLSPL
jgi:Conserved TM helix